MQSPVISTERYSSKIKRVRTTVASKSKRGRIFDVAVDLRKKSKTYGKCFSKILSAKNSLSIYIPPGFAHGFCALDKENFVVYSCTQYRNAKSEIGIKYNDQDLNIRWPIKKPILSIKDKKNYSLKDFYNING